MLILTLLSLLVSPGQCLVPPRPVSCPPTSLCVQLCCPPNHLYTRDIPGDLFDDVENEDVARLFKPKCQPYDGDIRYTPEVDQSFRPRDVELVGGLSRFSCLKNGSTLVSAQVLFDPIKYRLTSTGQLKVFLDQTEFLTFENEDFCVAFTKIEKPQSDGNILFASANIQPIYSVCFNDFYEHEEQQVIEDSVYPATIFISDFFVLLTLITYLSISEFRTNLFGQITIGFLINVFLSYLFTGIHYSLDLKENKEWLDTRSCTALGYLIQHTLVALFFWMSAMSIFITRTMLNSFTEHKSSNPTRTLMLNIVYAQGSSLIVSMVTLIMDNHGDPRTHVLPHIGELSCWFKFDPDIPFHASPEFLYFYLIIIFILSINIVCFVRTGLSLLSHWWQMRGMAQGSVNELFKTQLLTVTKLFIIMGIPWVFDVASAAIKHSQGWTELYNINTTYNVILDILNLLTGVLIFISLACKSIVWKRMKQYWSRLRYSATNTSEPEEDGENDEENP